ncbi:hypothetical protein CEUSTIGMA_g10666.t1 [Chlamydomonas eustigma]|uniref:Uncharacterized protein n=1 Tax=Chlamydomonas eustigma TaxID=1157962 RepID=A0A250XKB1_9CHLO|nr:hypothetical protein CEUSTIGMA_g10666.t1 [Chlamydomonas eustigma]|eukprot:GAX83240.1 hypothetical protein CEUSTIGMA_g10666.t1 [Chlamydomonas eustigma]
MTISSMELQHEASAISSCAEQGADTSTAPLPHSVGNSVNPQGASGDDASRRFIMPPTRRFCAHQQQVSSTMIEAFAVVVKETKGGHEVDVGSHTSLAELQVQPLQVVPSKLTSSRPPSPAAVRAYAEYLGMDGVRDQDLFYIAQLALLAELPPSCTVHFFM